ncbi:MAG: HD domain-containing protein [Thermoleophilia bacterium]|nr:HD domain-containing protein [Thermoleophilia bacterium]MDH3725320.1 HD domain-containing protein [Thermoleophilia bacterium]
MSVPNPVNAVPATLAPSNARVVVASRRRARREQLAAALRRVGYRVRTSAPPAVAALTNRSDVVVLEWGEGVALTRGGPPVIALLPRERADQIMPAIEAGVADYVLGPVTTEELTARVELAARRQTRTGARPLGGRATDLTLRCAADGTIISANGSARAITGLRPDDLISLPWPGLAHADEAEQVARRLAEAFANPDEVVGDSHRVRRGDDRHIWVETRCRVVNGVAEIVVRDVSNAKRDRDREIGLRRVATMVARRDSIADIGSVATGLACRLLDAHGAALVGPHGIVAATGDVGVAFLGADGDPDGGIERAGVAPAGAHWGQLVVRGASASSAEGTAWLSSVAELIALYLAWEDGGHAAAALTLDHSAFVDRLARESARAARYGRPLALSILGLVDGPARRVLDVAAAAEKLRATARAGETIAVIDGGRLAWLLPESDSVAAWQAAERVRCAMAQTLGDGPHLTAGVAELTAAGESADLLARAGRALEIALVGCADAAVVHTSGLEALLVSGRHHDIESLAAIADRLLPDGEDHARRVAQLATSIAAELGWSSGDVQRLRDAALLHDIGKAALPTGLVDKPGILDTAELCLVHSHAAIGGRISARSLDAEQCSWVRGHHERWDGEGYPDALLNTDIPEGARILALADSWDAMTSDRPYRGPRDAASARQECARCSGAQFWPQAVEALAALLDRGRLSGSVA